MNPLARLAWGDIVRCPDGTIGRIGAVHGRIVTVIHDDRRIGRGPWHFTVGDLSLADSVDALAYCQRTADIDPSAATALERWFHRNVERMHALEDA